MALRFRFRSLKTRFAFWFAFVALAPVILCATWLYTSQVDRHTAQAMQTLLAVRDQRVRDVNNWLDERIGDLAAITGGMEIESLQTVLSKQRRNGSDRATPQAARDMLHRYVDQYEAFEGLAVVDATGAVMIAAGSIPLDRRGFRQVFARTTAQSEACIQEIRRSADGSRPLMTFSQAMPGGDQDGEEVVGVVVAAVDLEGSLYALLQDPVGLGATGETLIVDRAMQLVSPLKHTDAAPLSLTCRAEPARRGAAGEVGAIEAQDYRGVGVLAAYAHIDRTGWGLVAKQDRAEVRAAVHGAMGQFSVVLVVCMAVVGVAGFFVARTLARPIERVATAAGRIESGDMTVRCGTDTPDELGRLSRAFDRMVESIQFQMAVRQGAGDFADSLVSVVDRYEFCHVVAERLTELTDSAIGAVYVRGRDGGRFELAHGVGLPAEAPRSFDADAREGQFAEAIRTQRVCYIEDIPSDTSFIFKTVAGAIAPRQMVAVPLVVGNRVTAVAAFATITGYTEQHRAILKQIHTGMNTSLANHLAAELTSRMAGELQVRNEELAATNEQLQSQSDELTQQAEELRRTAAELEAQRIQVEQADRLKSEFLSNMSHELRTPLNSVMALSQLMITRGTGQNVEQETQYLKVIEKNGRQLLHLINDVLDLSKIEAGRMDVSVGEFALDRLVDDTVQTVRPLAGEKDLEIVVDMPEPIRMTSDEDKVRQILLNLLSNAVKFTERGTVSVTVTADETHAKLAVTDSGIGISPEDLETIFDEFRQADGSTTRRYEGTGLGLAICQKLSRLLLGRVSVESQMGEGSTFTATIPLKHAQRGRIRPARRAILGEHAAGVPSSGRTTILVVEDNHVAAMQVASVLTDGGFDVRVAASGREALDRIADQTPDAIILDLMMPEMDGFEVLRQIRAVPATADLPVLVLTAKDLDGNDRDRLAEGRAAQLIQKGRVDRDQLLAAVCRLSTTAEELPAAAPEAEPDLATAAPIVPDEPEPFDIVADPVSAAESLANKTILIVEDNPDNQLTLFAVLDDIGLGCIMAEDGQQGVDVARKHRPDLILMDIQLPVLSGIDATRQIKADPDLEHIPIIALTAKAMKGDREEAMAAGCDDYMPKPIDAAQLAQMLRHWLCCATDTARS